MKKMLLSITIFLLIVTVGSGDELTQPLKLVIQSKNLVYKWEETVDITYELTNVSKQDIALFKLPVLQKIIDSKGNVFSMPDYRDAGYNPQINLKPKESFRGLIALSRIELSMKDRTLGAFPVLNEGENQIMLTLDFWSSIDAGKPVKITSNFIIIKVVKK